MLIELASLFGIFTATFLPVPAASAQQDLLKNIPPAFNFQFRSYVLAQLYEATFSTDITEATSNNLSLTICTQNGDVDGEAAITGSNISIYPSDAIYRNGTTTEAPLYTLSTGANGCAVFPSTFSYNQEYGYRVTAAGFATITLPTNFAAGTPGLVIHENLLSCSQHPSACTDSLTPPAIAMAITPTTAPTVPIIIKGKGIRENPPLRLFIGAPNKYCTMQGDNIAFRMVARNYGKEPVKDVTLQMQYPTETSFLFSDPQPDIEIPNDHISEFHTGEIVPGDFVSYVVQVKVNGTSNSAKFDATAFYNYKEIKKEQVLTTYTVSGACTASPAPAGTKIDPNNPIPSSSAPTSYNSNNRVDVISLLENIFSPSTAWAVSGLCGSRNECSKASPSPAIVCDPTQKPPCEDTYQSLDLGVNYKKALDKSMQVRICSKNDPRPCDPNMPTLGVRFSDAKPDIVPGDCSVQEDWDQTSGNSKGGDNNGGGGGN